MTSLLTYLGKSHDLTNPKPADIDLRDIAHALGNLCRFNGHARTFYSIAQHACMVASMVPPEHRPAALLRDAASAYLGHLMEPLKRCLPSYCDLERLHWLSICERFQIDPELPEVLQSADLVVTATEQRDLIQHTPGCWLGLAEVEPIPQTIRPWNAQKARIIYLQRLIDELGVSRQARRILTAHPGIAGPLQSPADKTEATAPRAACRGGITQAASSGFSTAQVMPLPTRNRLRRTPTDVRPARRRGCTPAQPAQGYEASAELGGQSRDMSPWLSAVDAINWGEWLVCDETLLAEMTEELVLPETIHHQITEWQRRRVE